jgi:hypothetical protein
MKDSTSTSTQQKCEELGIAFSVETTAATAETPGVAVEEKIATVEEITGIATVEEITGSVPLFVADLLADNNVARHDLQVIESVKFSLMALEQNAVTWNRFKDATIASVLQLRTPSTVYDKKFFTLKESTAYEYEALVPQVITACKEHLWVDVLSYVSHEETALLSVCRSTTTLNSARGQHFEYMVWLQLLAISWLVLVPTPPRAFQVGRSQQCFKTEYISLSTQNSPPLTWC